MNTLRLQLRFLAPLVLVLVVATWVASVLLDELTSRWFARDMNMRGALVAATLEDSISRGLDTHHDSRLEAVFERALKDERLYALALCGPDGVPVRRTANFPGGMTCPELREAAARPDHRMAAQGGAVHVGYHPIQVDSGD